MKKIHNNIAWNWNWKPVVVNKIKFSDKYKFLKRVLLNIFELKMSKRYRIKRILSSKLNHETNKNIIMAYLIHFDVGSIKLMRMFFFFFFNNCSLQSIFFM